MYGDEQREAEQRVYIYVQQPKRYKTPDDIARKDADIAHQIERMERLIDDLREHFPGKDRAKAFARFSDLQKQYPGIASVKDVARRSWERK